jgi:hypothetical protein
MSKLLAIAALSLLALVGCASSTLTLPANPPLVLRIDPSFRPLKAMTFPIDSFTDVDRRVFVHADEKGTILRLAIVQFERVQPGSSFRFAFPPRPPAQFGAHTYRFGAYANDDEAEAAKSPGKEAARTRALLVAEGYKVPKVFRVARLARVGDRDGMTEFIIFYMEGADADFPMRPLPMADEDGDMPLGDAEAKSILLRLKAAITPVSG